MIGIVIVFLCMSILEPPRYQEPEEETNCKDIIAGLIYVGIYSVVIFVAGILMGNYLYHGPC